MCPIARLIGPPRVRLLIVARSTLDYQSRPAVRDAPAVGAMRHLAAQYPRCGY